jgi:hypothetical protein
MHSTNYTATLITPSPDCPAVGATPPPKPGTVADLQFRALAVSPGQMTSDDVIWSVTCSRTGGDPADQDARAAFFGRPMACLRASPLVKTYGWAIHHDGLARVTLVDPGTAAYRALLADPGTAKVSGMRSARA